MKKLSDDEYKVLNNFDEYYKHLCKSNVLESVGISEDPDELKLLNIGAAIALAVIKGNEKEDYFA